MMAPGRQSRQSEKTRAAARNGGASRMLAAIACVALGTLLCALSVQSMLDPVANLAGNLMSSSLWKQTVETLGGQVARTPSGNINAIVPLGPIIGILALFSTTCWLAGGAWIHRRCGRGFAESLAHWGMFGWIWWIAGGSWELARLAAYLIGNSAVSDFILFSPAYWITVGGAGWLATFLVLSSHLSADGQTQADSKLLLTTQSTGDGYRVPLAVWLCYFAYVVVFVAMNWQLYRGLLLPHGDSAMYEEHLWNVLHGKGFRSYLDRGLFLGEHLQVIHLLLIPLYVLWPSQMNLELCGSAILAAGCFPVYWMARRHSGNGRAAVWLAAAYLLAFPVQYLDIGIELKTFRPNGLGIPVLLFALDQLERRRYKTLVLLLALALSAQEDYAIVLAPLGIWIAFRQVTVAFPNVKLGTAPATSKRRLRVFGACLAIFSVVYLLVSTRLVMAWFRDWQEIHYAAYFAKFGKTLPEIAWTMLTKWGFVWDEFVTPNTGMYVLALLVPVGLLSLFSPGRLAVGLPLFLTLALNEVLSGARHHAHAAIMPILFWSAAAGLATVSRFGERTAVLNPVGIHAGTHGAQHAMWWARFACLCALLSGAFFGLSPLSVAFWDSGSQFYWKRLYVPGKRAEYFPRVFAQIPLSARVASTDFIHPRFTHHERSYDYSDYPRAVNHGKPGAPDDTDYIVIDTRHPYSKIQQPDQIREYREHPEQWELLPDKTDGYFIILKRRRPAAGGRHKTGPP